jgi:hypothetical protein
MKAEDLIELAKDRRFISGISHYCDNWCERCAFTSRCLSYAQLRADFDDDDPASHDLNSPKFLEKLKENFETTKELLIMGAEKCGIDVNSIELDDEEWEDQKRRDREAREDPLVQSAERYTWMVKEWFDANHDAINLAYSDSLGTGNEILPEELEDAIEVIQWYMFIPPVKLFRVIHNDGDDKEQWWIDYTNGSAKVALIGMDRSIIAWNKMKGFFPETAYSIGPIVEHLEELRSRTEREIPDARSFIRPGLDEITDRVM